MVLERDLPLILVFGIAFAVAMVVAAAETALLRIPLVRALTLAGDGDRRARRVAGLLERLTQVLNAVLLTALLAQITVATVTGILAERWFGSVGVTIASVLLTVVLFIYAEAIPKTFAVRHAQQVAMALSLPMVWLERVLRPLVSVLIWIADIQMPGRGVTTSPTVTEDELRYLASRAAREGEITGDDLRLIERGFRFGDRRTDDIMVPRTDIVAVAAETPAADALQIALDAGHRRIPVFEGSVENITGVVLLRDLAALPTDRRDLPVARLATEPLVVPESKRIVDLLTEMQAAGTHLAVVVDEFGGTAGLVTVEDIAEELIGTISESGVVAPMTERGPGHWVIDASLPVEDLAEALEVDLPEGDWNTVAGLMMGVSGRVLELGDEVETGDVTLRVAGTRRRRVTRIEVRLASSTTQDG